MEETAPTTVVAMTTVAKSTSAKLEPEISLRAWSCGVF